MIEGPFLRFSMHRLGQRWGRPCHQFLEAFSWLPSTDIRLSAVDTTPRRHRGTVIEFVLLGELPAQPKVYILVMVGKVVLELGAEFGNKI